MTLPHLSNAQARSLFLDRHGLMSRPAAFARPCRLLQQVEILGFVQVDSINTLARAHDHILYARNTAYRAPHLPPLLETRRDLFEAWTHDAAVVPMAFYPHWRHKFARSKARLSADWQNRDGREGFHGEFDRILRRLADDGPLTSKELGDGQGQNGGGWWDWKPTKTALEYLWRTGDVAVCHRKGFTKVYALTEQVIPPERLNSHSPYPASLDWSAMGALARLGFGTSADLSRFWEIFPKDALSLWADQALSDRRVVQGVVETLNGPQTVLLPPDWETHLAMCPPASDRVRILSPFDPAIRDRKRMLRLFGFDYRIEVFVPEAKRTYGYYVFPILEGTRFIGRIDLKMDRKQDLLRIQGIWLEPKVTLGTGRAKRLAAEITRLARFAGATSVAVIPGPKTGLLAENAAFMAHI